MKFPPPARLVPMVFLLAAAALAAELPFHGFDNSIYDRTGRLVRRLRAEDGTYALKESTLRKGRLEVFGPDSATAPGAVLTFSDALYRKDGETISSEHDLKLVSADGMVAGRNFVCRLDEGILEIKEAAEAELKGYRLTGQNARVRYDPEAKGKDLVREIVMTGKVEVTPLPGKKLPFDYVRMETSEARYDSAGQRILARNPIVGWDQEGRRHESSTSEEFLVWPLEK